MAMTLEEKREHLRQLSEDALRRKVLIPLLTIQGFHDPILHHHANEKGKDIICKELDDKFGKTRYIAVIVKSGNITGSSSGSNSYFALLNQIRQALNERYKHIYDLREIYIDQVIIVTSGEILPTAMESAFETLKRERLDKNIRETIDGSKLLGLIDKFFPTYWDEISDEKSSLVKQRNILLNNLGKLLKVLINDPIECNKALHNLAAQELDVELLGMRDFARYMLDVSYRRVNIEEIDPSFTLPHLNTDYENIKKTVLDLKKSAQKALVQMDDRIEPLRRILEATNPKEILGYCQDIKYNTNQFGYMGVNVSDINDGDLDSGIQQYEYRRDILEQKQQSALYVKLVNDMHEKVIPALLSFWEKHPKAEANWWLGYSVQFSFTSHQIIQSTTYEVEKEPKVLREDKHFHDIETSKAFLDNDGCLHIEFAINRYGFPAEDRIRTQDKAVEFMWWYEKSLADEFFEII